MFGLIESSAQGPPGSGAGAFAAFHHNEADLNTGGDLLLSFTSGAGVALIIITGSFQATPPQGYQASLTDNGGANLIPFDGTFKPMWASDAGTPVQMFSFAFAVTLAAGSHAFDLNLVFALGTSGNSLRAGLYILHQ